RTEDEIAGSELFFAVHRPEHGAATDDEEHLLGAVMHVHSHAERARGQVPEGRAHPSIVRAPEDAMHQPGLGTALLRVPRSVGEQVLTVHGSYLRCASGGGKAVCPPSAGQTLA